jgi:hypothetical protein
VPNKVDSIRISSFRGATTPLTLRFKSHPLVLIFGENGTGKSTVADAFGFVCNREESGALSGYSITGLSKYVPSLGKPASAISVELIAGQKRWTASSGPSGVVVAPLDAPDPQILRRRTILRLIEGKPKDRYEALKELIDVPKIEHAELSLRAAYKSANDELTQATSALAQATEAVDNLWMAEGKPGASAVAWAQAESAKDQAVLKASVVEADAFERQYIETSAALAAFKKASTELADATVQRAQAESRRKAIETDDLSQSADLLRLLQDSQAFLAQHETLESCPVCEQGIVAAGLNARLLGRINAMRSLSEAIAASETADRLVTDRATAETVRRKDFFLKARALGRGMLNSSLPAVAAIRAQLEQSRDFLESVSDTEEQSPQALALWTAIEAARGRVTSVADANRKSIALHGSINTQLTAVRGMTSKAQELDRLSTALKSLLDIVSRCRKNHIDGILQRIGADVERLYTQLHPGESLGGVRFFLKPTAIGSLEFDATFYGATKVPPQAYYSESHLDTLGICVCLSREKDSPTSRHVMPPTAGASSRCRRSTDCTIATTARPHCRNDDLSHSARLCWNRVAVARAGAYR